MFWAKNVLAKNISLGLIVGAAILSLAATGCGGGSTSAVSQAQAQAVTQQISEAATAALQASFNSDAVPASQKRLSLAKVMSELPSETVSPCLPTSSGETCNFPVSYTGSCPGGGTISVAGDVDGSLNSSGGGSIQSQLTVTPTNCSVQSLVLNGDPSVSVTGQIGFTASAPIYPITLTETGGLSYGPKPAQSCQFNVTYTVSSATSCTISGTACGQSVSGSC